MAILGNQVANLLHLHNHLKGLEKPLSRPRSRDCPNGQASSENGMCYVYELNVAPPFIRHRFLPPDPGRPTQSHSRHSISPTHTLQCLRQHQSPCLQRFRAEPHVPNVLQPLPNQFGSTHDAELQYTTDRPLAPSSSKGEVSSALASTLSARNPRLAAEKAIFSRTRRPRTVPPVRCLRFDTGSVHRFPQ